VPDYRFYPVTAAGRQSGLPEHKICRDDAAATAEALHRMSLLSSDLDIEVWDGVRLVIHLYRALDRRPICQFIQIADHRAEHALLRNSVFGGCHQKRPATTMELKPITISAAPQCNCTVEEA